jgi:hypothetical protein
MLRMGERVSAKKEHDLTATLHLGREVIVGNSPSHVSRKTLEKISEEDREIVANLAPEDAMLIVHRGPGMGSRFLVTKVGATIGRSPDNEIFLNDVTVSRKHAEVLPSVLGIFSLKDLGSLNGTYVDGKPVVEIPLVHGDEIQIGKFHMLFFRGKNERTSAGIFKHW